MKVYNLYYSINSHPSWKKVGMPCFRYEESELRGFKASEDCTSDSELFGLTRIVLTDIGCHVQASYFSLTNFSSLLIRGSIFCAMSKASSNEIFSSDMACSIVAIAETTSA